MKPPTNLHELHKYLEHRANENSKRADLTVAFGDRMTHQGKAAAYHNAALKTQEVMKQPSLPEEQKVIVVCCAYSHQKHVQVGVFSSRDLATKASQDFENAQKDQRKRRYVMTELTVDENKLEDVEIGGQK